jgi:septal ring factor EnvC (AmiA/AmiB activator)
MGLFKDRPNLNDKFLHIDEALFEEGGNYRLTDNGDGTAMVVIVTTKPIAIVNREEWDSLHEELKKSRAYVASLKKTNDEQRVKILQLEKELAELQVKIKRLEKDLADGKKATQTACAQRDKAAATILECDKHIKMLQKQNVKKRRSLRDHDLAKVTSREDE